jgi:hypothetical protein
VYVCEMVPTTNLPPAHPVGVLLLVLRTASGLAGESRDLFLGLAGEKRFLFLGFVHCRE